MAGLDLGVLPIGDWSISITFSKFSKPSILSNFAGVCFEPLSFDAAALKRVSIIKVDLPPPDTPVTHINNCVGKQTRYEIDTLWNGYVLEEIRYEIDTLQ